MSDDSNPLDPKVTLSCSQCTTVHEFSIAHGRYPVPEVCSDLDCALCLDKRPPLPDAVNHAYPVLSHNHRFLQHLRTIDRKVSLSG